MRMNYTLLLHAISLQLGLSQFLLMILLVLFDLVSQAFLVVGLLLVEVTKVCLVIRG